jgi:hypothetical protein
MLLITFLISAISASVKFFKNKNDLESLLLAIEYSDGLEHVTLLNMLCMTFFKQVTR